MANSPLGCDIAELARGLTELPPPEGVYFFAGLLDGQINGQTLHYLFAIMRDAIAEQAKSPWAALYAPLATVGEDAGDFPLHCDMYVPEMLWNVFEDVPRDGSGAAIFLQTKELLRILDKMKSFPRPLLNSVRYCFTTPLENDRYKWLYDKLHGQKHAWTAALGRRLSKRQIRISMRKGDGYLVHDRRWLHGREEPTIAVSKKRVHRLVFDVVSSACGDPSAAGD